MPLDHDAAFLALIDAPIPYHIPWGSRRIEDPVLEARVATRWFTRQTWEADGYHFPDHPRPRVPRALRCWHPDLPTEDDAADVAAQAEAGSRSEAPEPVPPGQAPRPPAGHDQPAPSPSEPDSRPSPNPKRPEESGAPDVPASPPAGPPVAHPAGHNAGHLYKAKPQLAAFHGSLDPLHRLNPGIGGTPRSQGAPT